MVIPALLLVVFAALLSAYSAICYLFNGKPSLLMVAFQMVLAVSAVAVFVGWLAVQSPDPLALFALVLFVGLGIIGGVIQFIPHFYNRDLPKPVVLLQSSATLVAYGLIVYSFLR